MRWEHLALILKGGTWLVISGENNLVPVAEFLPMGVTTNPHTVEVQNVELVDLLDVLRGQGWRIVGGDPGIWLVGREIP